jgi:hypothetical protein
LDPGREFADWRQFYAQFVSANAVDDVFNGFRSSDCTCRQSPNAGQFIVVWRTTNREDVIIPGDHHGY